MLAIDDLDDLSVIHVCHAIGKLEDAWIMGDHDECSVGTLRYASQDLHRAVPGLVIEAACRLVADNQLRFMPQRAGDRNALLLATAELSRKRVKARAEIDRFERLFRACFRVLSRYAVNQQWYGDVLHCVKRGQKVEELKHEADRKAAKACTLSLAHALQVVAEHLALAGILVQDRRNAGNQGRLPAPRRTNQHEQFTATDVEVDT